MVLLCTRLHHRHRTHRQDPKIINVAIAIIIQPVAPEFIIAACTAWIVQQLFSAQTTGSAPAEPFSFTG